MKNRNAKSLNSPHHMVPLIGLLFAGLLVSPARVSAIEDPPNCSLAHGGAGSVSQGGMNFNLAQAHVGDTVQVFASLGKVTNSCKAINATGTVYIATGMLANFLVDVTLIPGVLVGCPANALCQPGPYNITITPALVGAGVSTPLGDAPGVAKTVRAAENGFGTVLAGEFNSQFSDFHTASIQIVTPCLQVVKQWDYPAGQTCFHANERIRFRGSVTNCGDITLTNVTVMDDRAGAMQLLNSANGSPLLPPVALAPGASAVFSNSFQPTQGEVSTGKATNTVTATGTDTTAIGGPRASVTNNTTAIGNLCPLPIAVPLKAVKPAFSNLTPGRQYQLQASADLNTWYNQGPPFTATNANMVGPSYYDVDAASQLFFRLSALSPSAALQFNGTNSYLTMNQSFLGGATVADFSIEFWVKNKRPGIYQQLGGKTEFWKEWSIGFPAGGKVDFFHAWPNTYYVMAPTNAVIAPNQWQHVAVVGQGTLGSIYVDGMLIYEANGLRGEISFNAVATGSAIAGFTLGFRDNTTLSDDGWFQGDLADYRIWDIALSGSQVVALYAQNPATNASGLRHWIPFNEGAGSTFHDIIGGLQGQLFNTTWGIGRQ